MSHSIILTDQIDLIIINDQSYDLSEWSEQTGISRKDLIKSATTVEEIDIYYHPEEKTIAQIYDEVLEANEWERNHFNQ